MKKWLKPFSRSPPSQAGASSESRGKADRPAPAPPSADPTDLLLKRLLDSAGGGRSYEVSVLLERPEVADDEHLLAQLASRSFNLCFHEPQRTGGAGDRPSSSLHRAAARSTERRALLVLLQLLPLLPRNVATFYLMSMHSLVQSVPSTADFAADARVADHLLRRLSQLSTELPEQPPEVQDGDPVDGSRRISPSEGLGSGEVDGHGENRETVTQADNRETVTQADGTDAAHVEAAELRELLRAHVALVESVGSHRLTADEARALLGLVRQLTPAESGPRLWLRVLLMRALASMLSAPPPSGGTAASAPTQLAEVYVQLCDGGTSSAAASSIPPTAGRRGGAAGGAAGGVRLHCGVMPAGKPAFSLALWLLVPHNTHEEGPRSVASVWLPASDSGERVRVSVLAQRVAVDDVAAYGTALSGRGGGGGGGGGESIAAASTVADDEATAALRFELATWGGGEREAETVSLGTCVLTVRKWHLLAITHARGSGGFGVRLTDDEVILHLDGSPKRPHAARLPAGSHRPLAPGCSLGADTFHGVVHARAEPTSIPRPAAPNVPPLSAWVRSAVRAASRIEPRVNASLAESCGLGWSAVARSWSEAV